MATISDVSREKGKVMTTSQVSSLILDRLAEGASFKELQTLYGFSKKDLIAAAISGVEELHSEYINMLIERFKSK
ncbi:MAG: hypothetical protein HQM09_03380 [Candidatus Riflebacteria bacterium]|nr:hypothetical protein [Candidatus Riflebacteria bacterium]